MLTWWEEFIWATLGLFVSPAKAWALSLEHDWHAKMVAIEAGGTESYSYYKLFQTIRFEWLICDPIMFKYFLFHPFYFWIPPFNPFGYLFSAATDIPSWKKWWLDQIACFIKIRVLHKSSKNFVKKNGKGNFSVRINKIKDFYIRIFVFGLFGKFYMGMVLIYILTSTTFFCVITHQFLFFIFDDF